MPALSTLVDDFGGTLALWPASYGGPMVVDGRARIPCTFTGTTPDYRGLKSAATYTLAGSQVAVELVTVPALLDATEAVAELQVGSTAGGRETGTVLAIEVHRTPADTTLRCVSLAGYVAQGTTPTPLAYDPVAHRHLRIRVIDGTAYWETSPDAAAWTVRRTLAAPGWTGNADHAVILQSYRADGNNVAGVGYAEFDNVNTRGASSSFSLHDDAFTLASVAAGNFTLGEEFSADEPTQVDAIRYRRQTTGVVAVEGALFDVATATEVTGTRVTFTGAPTANLPAWHTQALTAPVTLTVGRRYRVAVRFTGFGFSNGYFSTGTASTDVVSGPLRLHSKATATGGAQGSFVPGTTLAYPTQFDANAATWGVDVVASTPKVTGRRNLATNPSFETGTANWTAGAGTLGRVVASAPVGAAYGRVTASSSGVYAETTAIPIVVGQRYTYSISAARSDATTAAPKTIRLDLDWYGPSGYLSTDDATFTVTTNGWARRTVSAVAPTGATSARAYIAYPASTTGAFAYLDGLLFEQSTSTTAAAYADGDSAGWQWDGTAHASTSQQLVGSPVVRTLEPAVVQVAVQAVDLVDTGRTLDLTPVTVTARVSALRFERAVDAPAVATTVGVRALRFERELALEPAVVQVALPALAVVNMSVTPVRIRVGVVSPEVVFRRVTALTEQQAPAYTRPRKGLRFLAQEVLSRRWVSWDLAIREPEITWNLSKPTEIVGKLSARELYSTGLDEWAHYLHAEQDGIIRASAILMPWSPGGEEIEISASGVTRYPHGMPYQGDFTLGNPVGQQIDPLDVVRHVWSHLQAYPEGKLGVVLSGAKTTVRIGTPERDVSITTAAGETADFTAGPYLLKWFEDTDAGKEIDDLAKETPFDYREMPYWNPDRTDVVQFVELGYPRLGRDRSDLTFTQGENLIEALAPVEDDEGFASEVIVLGKGEGIARVRGRAGGRIGNRVRRATVVEAKDVASTDRANSKAADERRARQGLLGFDEVSLLGKHRNAPFGAFAVGDDIPVKATVEGVGRVVIRHRVAGYTYRPEVSELIVATRRSDSYTYAAPVS